MNIRKFYRIYFIMICFIVVIMSLFLGYIVSNIVYLVRDSFESVGVATASVLMNPFRCQFNKYTPTCGIILFAVFQLFLAILYYKTTDDNDISTRKNNKRTKDNITDKRIEDVGPGEEIDLEEKSEFTDEEDIFASMLDIADIENIDEEYEGSGLDSNELDILEENEKEEVENVREEYTFSQDVMDDLTIFGFDVLQISAMLNIKKYIEDVDAEFLSKIFNTSMTPEEIEKYIKLFYEQ